MSGGAIFDIDVQGKGTYHLVDCGGLLSRSAYIQRLNAGGSQSGGLNMTITQETFEVIKTAVRIPSSASEYAAWEEALDFLIINPPPHVVRLVAHFTLKEVFTCPPPKMIYTYGDFIESRHFSTPALTSMDPLGYDAPSPQEMSRSPPVQRDEFGPEDMPLAPLLTCTAVRLSRLVGLWSKDDDDKMKEDEDTGYPNSVAKECGIAVRDLVRRALIRLAGTRQGCASILLHLEEVYPTLELETFRYVVYEAMRSMYLAEITDCTFVDIALETVLWMSKAYRNDILTVNTLAPFARSYFRNRLIGILPSGLAPSSETPNIVTSLVELRHQLTSRVPWLPNLFKRRPQGVYVTGSLLNDAAVFIASKEGGQALSTFGDVDIFCLNHTEIEGVANDVLACMKEWTDGVVAGGVAFDVSQSHPTKFVMRCPDMNISSLRVDVYSHPLKRVQQYHLPQVRAAFDWRHLHISPSAAIAWIARLNIDIRLIQGSKSAEDVIIQKWKSGYNTCVSLTEYISIVAAMRQRTDVPAFGVGALRPLLVLTNFGNPLTPR